MAESPCPNCGASIPSEALSCPGCRRLTHAERLEALAKQAQTAEGTDFAEALRLWQEALPLLPPESQQAAYIRNRIAELGASVRLGEAPDQSGGGGGASGAKTGGGVGAQPGKRPPPQWFKKLGPVGVVLGVIWKAGAVALPVLGKAKFLLSGLLKIKTLLSMLAFFGVYWAMFGWPFALGFVLSIYVHEMGHVWSLRGYGLRASVPMFIPFLGAIISLYDSPADVHQDARIGLAGPIWGAGAAITLGIAGAFLNSPLLLALSHTAAFMNLFNLIPVWQLDGGRGFRALAFPQRLMLGALALVLWAFTHVWLFLFIALGAAFRSFWQKDHSPVPDTAVLIHFAGLLILFAVMLYMIPVAQLAGLSR